MEHVTSTIAATAFIVASLVTASHVLYPHDPSAERPRVRPAAASAQVPLSVTTWTEPPLREAGANASPSKALELPSIETPRAASFTLMPAEWTALPPAREAALQPEPSRKVDPTRRRKLAQAATRSRPAPATRAAAVDQSATVGDDAAKATQGTAKIDLIGDLLRGLGIGRDNQG